MEEDEDERLSFGLDYVVQIQDFPVVLIHHLSLVSLMARVGVENRGSIALCQPKRVVLKLIEGGGPMRATVHSRQGWTRNACNW